MTLPASPSRGVGIASLGARRRVALLFAALALLSGGGINAGEPASASEPVAVEGTATVEGDARLARYIEQRLAWDRELARFDLDARIEAAVVHLSGHVATMAQSHRARQLVETIEGVNAVVNATYVDPTLAVAGVEEPKGPDDVTLGRRVERVVRRDTSIGVREISASARDGIVTLSGTVDDFGSKQRAAQAVRGLQGVGRVNNALTVVPADR